MAAPKIFRIEKTFALQPDGADGEAAASPAAGTDLMEEISALRALLVAARRTETAPPELVHTTEPAPVMVPAGDAKPRGEAAETGALPVSRLVQELNAVVTGAERAALQILSAAETIDQIAIALADPTAPAAGANPAAEIRRLVGQIFESCHFQDLAGQRVTKVVAVLASMEEQLSRLLETFRNVPSPHRGGAAQQLHGPRLETDQDHASQDEIDAMFELGPDKKRTAGETLSPAAIAASGSGGEAVAHVVGAILDVTVTAGSRDRSATTP